MFRAAGGSDRREETDEHLLKAYQSVRNFTLVGHKPLNLKHRVAQETLYFRVFFKSIKIRFLALHPTFLVEKCVLSHYYGYPV